MMTETELKTASTGALWSLRDVLPATAAADLEQVNRELALRWEEMTPRTVSVQAPDREGEMVELWSNNEPEPGLC